jgi:transposase
MDHFAGLDVSVKETSVCILDDASKIVKEVRVASEPQALLKVLGNLAYRFKRIGLTIADLAVQVEPMLVVRRALREQIVILHRRLLAIVRNDEVCQRLMTTPGLGGGLKKEDKERL